MVQAARGDLDSQLNGLRGKLASIGSQWQGAGAGAFTTTMQRWDEQAKKITSALDTFEAELLASEKTYNTTDESQMQNYNNLQSRLG